MKIKKDLLQNLKNDNRKNYVERTVDDLYNMVAERTGVKKSTIQKIGGLESQHGKYEDNLAGSSAKGVFQLMPALIKSIKPEGLNSPKSFSTQEDVMTGYLQEIKKNLKKNAPEEELYAYHNLGYPKYKKLQKIKDNEQVSKVLSEKIINANKKLYKDKTKKQAFEEIRKMLNESSPRNNDIEEN